MMKSLKDYIQQSDTRLTTPVAGDGIDFEVAPGEIVTTYVVESTEDTLILAGDDYIMEMLSCADLVDETSVIEESIVDESTTDVAETAPDAFSRILELAGCGRMGEDQSAEVLAQKELAQDITDPMPGVHEGTSGRDTVEFDIPTFIRMLEYAREDAKDDMDLHDVAERAIELSQDGHTLTMDDYDVIVGSDVDGEEEMMDEAEYQGRKVPLGKPMRGDVKKFKVYVKDPKTGNVKKVNFGHGGTSAKRAGQKTMKIKKSDPARRRSFRARHRCDTAKDRTTARYWSCRMW